MAQISGDYDARVASQIEQYAAEGALTAKLPSIEQYWKRKYLEPKFNTVFPDIFNHYELYWKHFAPRIAMTNCRNLLSVGCGDASVEIGVAQGLLKAGVDFEFHLLELSPILLERAKENALAAGVTEQLHFHEADLNRWQPDRQFAGVMAHHVLHHVLDLEHLFAAIRSALHPNGVFCTFDMIGRNGHMRWPESLAVVNRIWGFLPEKKKYNHQLQRLETEFVNWDCAIAGFEGIRAQDILPILVETFKFESFFAWGGISDPFLSYAFGDNFNTQDPLDCAFVDFLQFLNELLIDLGYLKPTEMCAVMSLDNDCTTRHYKHWSPEFCVRKTT